MTNERFIEITINTYNDEFELDFDIGELTDPVDILNFHVGLKEMIQDSYKDDITWYNYKTREEAQEAADMIDVIINN